MLEKAKAKLFLVVKQGKQPSREIIGNAVYK